jgi:hypothetical protein
VPVSQRLLRLVSTDTPSLPVGVARVVLGVAAFVEVLAAISTSRVDKVLRAGVLETPRWDWFPRLSQDGGHVLLAVWLVAAVLFTVGWRARVTGGITFAAIAYYLAVDQQLYANHVYLLSVLVLLFVLADAGAAVSVDATRGRGRPRVARWPVFLLQAQVAVVYGFATLSKLNGDWFGGDVLEANLLRIGPVDLPSVLERRGVYVALAIGTVLVEGFLSFAFYVRRLQPVAVVVGLAFHLSIVLTVDRWSPYAAIGFTVFAMEMIALWIVCVGVPDRLAQGWPLRKNISSWIPSGSLKVSTDP